MTAAENKQRYADYIQAIFNEARFDELDGFLAPEYAIKDAPPGSAEGAAGIREVVTMFRTGFPDMVITLDEVIGEGDWVASKSTLRGTQTGEFFGVAPTGRPVSVSSLTMVRFRDGKLLESWVKNDVAAMMRQLQGGQA
jgi:predicted ester cyclase